MLRLPRSLERFRNRREIVLALPIPQGRQRVRVPFAVQNRLNDLATGQAHHVRDDFGQLDIHLLQRLLQMIDMAGGVANLHLPLTVVAPQGADRIGRSKRRPQQAVAVQTLNPLGVEHVGLGPGPATRELPRLDQPDLEAARLQQLEKRNPVNAGRFHRHRGHAARAEPRGDRLQIAGVGPESPHLRRQATRHDRNRRDTPGPDAPDRHADHVHVRMHVDAGRLRMQHRQRGRLARRRFARRRIACTHENLPAQWMENHRRRTRGDR
jgi:hypothetical protein